MESFDLELERETRLTPARLYHAWTEGWEHWFALPGTLRATVRVGEPLFFETEYQGARHPHYGRFLDLDPHRGVVLTWLTTATLGHETVLRVGFQSHAEVTRVQLSHRGFPSLELRDRHALAWPRVLEQQEQRLAAG